MAQTKKGDPHGLVNVQLGLVGTDGLNYGSTGSTAAKGTTGGLYVIDTPLSFGLPSPTRNTINFTGGNRWLGAYQYGFDTIGEFEFTVSGYDADLIALCTSGTVDQTTNTLRTYFSENDLRQTAPQLCVMATYRIQARGGTLEGADVYVTSIIPRAWVAPVGIGSLEFQAKKEYTFQVTPTTSSTLPHNLALSSTAMGLTNDRAVRVHVFSDYPLHMAYHIGAVGASANFTLPYKPVDSTVTINASENELTVNGSLTAATSVDTSTAVVTVAVPEGQYAGMLYGTNYVSP